MSVTPLALEFRETDSANNIIRHKTLTRVRILFASWGVLRPICTVQFCRMQLPLRHTYDTTKAAVLNPYDNRGLESVGSSVIRRLYASK